MSWSGPRRRQALGCGAGWWVGVAIRSCACRGVGNLQCCPPIRLVSPFAVELSRIRCW